MVNRGLGLPLPTLSKDIMPYDESMILPLQCMVSWCWFFTKHKWISLYYINNGPKTWAWAQFPNSVFLSKLYLFFLKWFKLYLNGDTVFISLSCHQTILSGTKLMSTPSILQIQGIQSFKIYPQKQGIIVGVTFKQFFI